VPLPTLNPDRNTTYLSSSVTRVNAILEYFSQHHNGMMLGENVEEWEQDDVENITCSRQSSLGRKASLKNIFNKKVAGTCFLPMES
jgi:hypothetical protein